MTASVASGQTPAIPVGLILAIWGLAGDRLISLDIYALAPMHVESCPYLLYGLHEIGSRTPELHIARFAHTHNLRRISGQDSEFSWGHGENTVSIVKFFQPRPRL